MASVKIFLSTVSNEFLAYREALRHDLTRHDVEIKVQEDFKDLGSDTLAKLDVYIAHCDAVVHLVGAMTGALPHAIEVKALRQRHPDLLEQFPQLETALDRISYTQWEAWLALQHGKLLFIAEASAEAPRGPKFEATDPCRRQQAEHLARLREAAGRFPGCSFKSPDELAKHITLGAILDLLVKARQTAPPRQPRNLPYPSLGRLFKGRETSLEDLRAALAAPDRIGAAVVGKALHGLGGIGKTRLAIEYAWRHAADYSALLFVPADTPEKLGSGLAALAGPTILDLPQQAAPQDAVKIEAVLAWLDRHPGWLMILDNIDDAAAAAAVETVLPRLAGGHVLITGRHGDFSRGVQTLRLDVLSENDATAYLLEATWQREPAPDDAARARELAGQLGGLALGLAQAAAYIDKKRISLARYLRLWTDKRATMLGWFDRHLVSYNHDVGLAATWATSVAILTPQARRLLDLCAFFDPAPIPKSLLDVALPISGDGTAAPSPEVEDAHEALAELLSYALVSPAEVSTGKANRPGFAMHRLVQAFTRDVLPEARRNERLGTALAWMLIAFEGHPQDVHSWPRLDPLAPHALALARHGDGMGFEEAAGFLFARLAILFRAKARFAEAEPLYRRALAIGEAHSGPDHPETAIRLNNLAQLLRTTNRLEEAEPLMRRALAIDEASYGSDHPEVAIDLNNLAELLQATNRFGEAEPHMRRALSIDEASYGPDHPSVAIRVSNLASLLYDTNRLDEAEPLMRRALSIDEATYRPDHPNVAIRLNNLAQLLQATNRLAEAEPLIRRALVIDEASYGHDHPDVAIDLNNLAALFQDTNRLAEAEPLIRRALAIDETSYGHDHPNVAITLNNLAKLLQATNRLSDAKPLMRRASAIFSATYGADHPKTQIAIEWIERFDHDERLI